MKVTFLSFLMLIACAPGIQAQDPASHVNPFIGTQISSQQDFGNTSPGATLPFGMLYWSPDPASGQFYNYKEPITRGFSLTHLSGPGCGVAGDVPILPMLGIPQYPPPVSSTPYKAGFTHDGEVAQPGYYAVKLNSGIRVQLAAALRSGIAEFTYPAGSDAHTVLFDLSRNLTEVNDAEIAIQGRKVSGWVSSGGFCSTGNRYKIYFVLKTEATPVSTGSFDELAVKSGVTSGNGPRTGVYLSFDSVTTTVRVKVGISYVSIANAEMNLDREIPGWGVDEVRRGARAAWNAVLSHVQVTGGSDAQQAVFYTALYHAMLHPSVFNDVNGEYIGFDDKVHRAEGRVQYANYSGWDIYRSQVQMITMLLPDVGSDIAESLVADAQQGGGLPIWPVANDESGVMAGDPSDGIIASIYAFGGRNFDTGSALKAMLHGATDPDAHVRLYTERPGLAEYLSKGYIANTEETGGAASVTLEDTNADFAIARFAKATGETQIEQQFMVRSAYWHNIFDPETKYIRARGSDGRFLPDFDAGKTNGFVEGNSAQYTWMIPYDLHGVVDAIGGPTVAKQRLDQYFSQYGSMAHQGPYFFIGNEPSFGDPWVYNWAGYPWRTQEVVRKTLGDLFANTPDGEPGNDDLGATSSWVVFGYLGFYPQIPGVGGVTTNSPVFPQVTLLFGKHPVRIVAAGAPEKLYVKSIALDGAPIRNWWIDWDQLAKAKELVFTMTDTPNMDAAELPPSFPASKQVVQ
jgi:predicted alpha-1,2-mannosidase